MVGGTATTQAISQQSSNITHIYEDPGFVQQTRGFSNMLLKARGLGKSPNFS